MLAKLKKKSTIAKVIYKCSPIEYLNSFDLLANKAILAHCVHVDTDGNDLNLIKEKVCKIVKILKKCTDMSGQSAWTRPSGHILFHINFKIVLKFF